ncbi:bifunctional folylpolyglutamate synthase/dihydrofolate synthase [Clostridium folliculivorans]|uniref:bifunctional folylpolyglutamate synthase/dihydrofolate synthase n=1 Tax=Clostridium folliculivorans TaxID=2886038 RepID=UPI0021C45B84|nr:folylpolyglutamate synthase/dihydrofolate synthase family protein [Clostridium folliculivorans]GKU29989.1 bifunctional folylpolyglutamate synthase/dihydrofolate synthase [Clostridium folliculivorans]
MNYDEAIKYITETAKFGSNYGLERTEKLLELLGSPHKKLKAIHIAGTNGKGSTTSMITSILMEAGYKVGMYTSPYIEEFEERIQINKNNIPKSDLAKVVTDVKVAVDEVVRLGYDSPTEFEIITAAMFKYFYDENVDYAVVEVGLGGRLDSTNVVTPILSVITSISFDHMNILGDTLEKIAYEKAGIIKENIPVVVYPLVDEAMKVIEKVASERNAKIYKVNNQWAVITEPKAGNNSQRILITTDEESYNIKLSLLGKHQLLNCTVAIKAIEVLKEIGVSIEKQHVLSALAKVIWSGRMEVMNASPLVVIDGAHNIDGITKLVESINTYFNYDKIKVIVGILADKQVEAMIDKISTIADSAIVTTPHNYRAEASTVIKELLDKNGVQTEIVEDYRESFIKAFSSSQKEDLILVCGSLYMIGDMRKTIRSVLKEVL